MKGRDRKGGDGIGGRQNRKVARQGGGMTGGSRTEGDKEGLRGRYKAGGRQTGGGNTGQEVRVYAEGEDVMQSRRDAGQEGCMTDGCKSGRRELTVLSCSS